MNKYILHLIPIILALYTAEAQVATTKPINKKFEMVSKLTEGDKAKREGDLVSAEQYYLYALEISEQLQKEKVSNHILILNATIFDPYDRLGELYLLAQNEERSNQYFSESLKLRNAATPGHSVFRVAPLIGLGKVFMQQHDINKALDYFKQAEHQLNRATTSFYNYEPLRRELHFNLFEIALIKKDYKSAKKHLETVSTGGMAATTTALSDQIPKVFELKGRYYLETGDFKKAEFYLDKAKQYANILSTLVVKFRILKSQALLKWSEKDIPAAAALFEELIGSYKTYIGENFDSMSEPERESFFANLREDFNIFNAFVLESQSSDQAQSLNESAYDNQLFSKALLLNEINKLKKQILESDNEDLKRKLAEWEERKANLASLYYQSENRQQEILSSQSQINELERYLNQQARLLRKQTIDSDWKMVQAKLGKSEAAIEIIRLNQFMLQSGRKDVPNYRFSDSVNYLVIMITSDIPPSSLGLKNGSLLEGRFLKYYRNCVQNQETDTLSYQAFWEPVKKILGAHATVYLSSDGVYNQINLNTLRNPKGGEYLLEEANLVFVTNTKDLLRPDQHVVSRKASLYARPDYRTKNQSDNSEGHSVLIRGLANEDLENFREQTFDDLPGTESEARGIENIFQDRQWKVNLNFKEAASESNLKADHNPGVLHIATHGFFLKEDAVNGLNSMLRSGIILAGVNNKTGSREDGILTAYEATSLSLDSTFLIVLSACETGLGQVENGEGVYGLQRGFAVAGARYLLMSLWKVDDAATALLMEQFYKSWLEGIEIHQALRKAQVALRNKYPQPYYWGAFVLLGN